MDNGIGTGLVFMMSTIGVSQGGDFAENHGLRKAQLMGNGCAEC
jgi:hypothetical protein